MAWSWLMRAPPVHLPMGRRLRGTGLSLILHHHGTHNPFLSCPGQHRLVLLTSRSMGICPYMPL